MMSIAGQQIEATTMYSMAVIDQELEVILNAMKTLSAFFPLSGAYICLSSFALQLIISPHR
jgi:hypothetical protein